MEFYERASITLTDGTLDSIKKFIKQHPDAYENPSHFIRCAIIKQLRDERKKGRYINEAIL